jgi:hypothetical protein
MNARSAAAAFGLAAAVLGAPAAAAPPDAPRCAGPEYRQFDFWLGDWDAYDADALEKPAARVCVDAILDGCAVHETYTGVDGAVGESFSINDASRRVWHQTWVTNRGQLLVLEGEFRDGRMMLRATETTAAGPVLWRGIWIPQDDGVRETAETSSDGGRSWKPRFDMVFRRHGGAPERTTPRPSP